MKQDAGFSCIELMVTLAIIGIVCASVVPSFQQYGVQSKRTQAQAALLQLMQQEERYFSQNNSYHAFSSSATDADAKLFTWWSGASAAHSGYELSGRSCTGQALTQCVQLDAVPGTPKVDPGFRDIDCQTLSLTSSGRRAASGPSGRCWP